MPNPWNQLSPEEKGALLLAYHEGKEIEVWRYLGGWISVDKPAFNPKEAYRVKPEPKRATVTLLTAPFFGWVAEPAHYRGDNDTHRITFETLDDEPVCDSIRMEKIK